MPDGRAIKLLVPEAYPKRPARAVTDQTVRFISELDISPCLPPSGVAFGMHARYNNDLIGVQPIEQAVRKAAEANSSCVAMQDWIGFWALADFVHSRLNSIEKLIPELRTVFHVSQVRALDVSCCGRS